MKKNHIALLFFCSVVFIVSIPFVNADSRPAPSHLPCKVGRPLKEVSLLSNDCFMQSWRPVSPAHQGFNVTTVTLTPVPVGGGIHPAYVQPTSIVFIATVNNSGGSATVTLDSTVKSDGSTTIRATVFNVYATGGIVYFSVNYQFYSNGVWYGSSQGNYSAQ